MSTTIRRKSVGAFGIAAAIVVVGATTAWACTAIMGAIKVCAPSTATCTQASGSGQTSTGQALPGAVIKVTGGGLKMKPATYSLFFGSATQTSDCHNATKILSSPAGVKLTDMRTDKDGNIDKDPLTAGIQAYKALLPATTPQGTATICAREKYPTPENTATAHATFTIMGGS